MKTFTAIISALILLGASQAGNAFTYTKSSVTLTAAPALVSAMAQDSVLSLYPNPSKGLTKLKLNQTINGNFKVRISNTIGKVVKVVDMSVIPVGEEVTIDLNDLPSGVYFYSSVLNEKIMETKRLIIQH